MRENPVENYTLSEMATLSWEMMKEEWHERGPTANFLGDFYEDTTNYSQTTQNELLTVALVAIIFTIHRYLTTKFFLNPFVKYVGFSRKDSIKFCESSCKFLYYSCLYWFEFYLVLYKYPELRYDVFSHWEGLTPTSEVPFDILVLYLVEAGFYFHSIYATIFIDTWKKDSIAMLLHHVLANSLIMFSLNFRYHRIGLVVLYLHDVADIVLESTKLVLCFKNKSTNPVLEVLSAIGFLGFTIAWFYPRLWVYPRIVLFSTAYIARTIMPTANFWFLFNTMLFALFGLNVWWFHFILALIYRIVTGQEKTVNDSREYDGVNSETTKTSNGKAKKEKAS